MANQPIRLAVLLSGGGRTMSNLQTRILAGSLNARIEIVISSRPDAGGIDLARGFDLPVKVVERRSLSPEAFCDSITKCVEGADLVCMAGFLSLWHIPNAWSGRVINIHPALLPEFGGRGMYGKHVHEAVIAAGKRESGCTVHLCDNEYDHGPIVLQRKVIVEPDDTPDALAARVFEQECIAYPEAIGLFAEKRVHVVDGRVRIR